jgi:hypothetical protein
VAHGEPPIRQVPEEGLLALARWEWEGGHIVPEREDRARPGREDQSVGQPPQETTARD